MTNWWTHNITIELTPDESSWINRLCFVTLEGPLSDHIAQLDPNYQDVPRSLLKKLGWQGTGNLND